MHVSGQGPGPAAMKRESWICQKELPDLARAGAPSHPPVILPFRFLVSRFFFFLFFSFSGFPLLRSPLGPWVPLGRQGLTRTGAALTNMWDGLKSDGTPNDALHHPPQSYAVPYLPPTYHGVQLPQGGGGCYYYCQGPT
jgi:hypothetical protein